MIGNLNINRISTLKNFFDLGFENSHTSHNPDKVIFNYSSHVLTDSEKSLLCRGLNFAIPPKTLEYADYLLPFELLHRNIHNLDITNEKKEVLKTRIVHFLRLTLTMKTLFKFNPRRVRSIKITFKK